jgi:hypothetical protein
MDFMLSEVLPFISIVCVDDGVLHFRLGLRAFILVRILYIYKIKTKTITGTNEYRDKL